MKNEAGSKGMFIHLEVIEKDVKQQHFQRVLLFLMG